MCRNLVRISKYRNCGWTRWKSLVPGPKEKQLIEKIESAEDRNKANS